MNEPRFVVSDVLWQRLAPRLRGKIGDVGATAKECAIVSSTMATPVSGSGVLAGAHRIAVARSAACLWPLEQPVGGGHGLGFSSVFSRL